MHLNIKESYNTAADFLEKFFKNPGDLGDLLSCMMLSNDGMPMDLALWQDWIRSAKKIKEHYKKTEKDEFITFTLKEAYELMIDYLQEFRERINSTEIELLLKEIILLDEKTFEKSPYWQEWINSTNKIKQLGDKAGMWFRDQFTQK